jgi:hypothetical protein
MLFGLLGVFGSFRFMESQLLKRFAEAVIQSMIVDDQARFNRAVPKKLSRIADAAMTIAY